MKTPERIICLTEETTETLYLLGEQDRIVGISGFTVRPPQARQEKPRVSAFTRAKIDKILALKPDLVLGFSDLQADIMAELVRAGLPVHVFNQRTVVGIFEMMRMLGAMLGEQEKAAALIRKIEAQVADVRQQASTLTRRPIVYFEEWNAPLITAIGWVSELIGIAGGEDCYPELSLCGLAKDRIIADPLDVARRQPDIIVGSWCGRKFRPQRVAERPGWQQVPAVMSGDIYGIASSDILQPGPAALTDGLQQLVKIIHNWASSVQVPADNLVTES